MSHSAQPVRGAHGRTWKVVGSATMRKSPPPSISAMPKPPPGVKTGNTVLCAVSLARSVVVIEQPLRIAAAASFASTVFPRKMPCWSGNDRRTTSSPRSSMHLSALAAASNCASFHRPWRSTKLRAFLSSEDDIEPPAAEPANVSPFIRAVRARRGRSSVQARGRCLKARKQLARSLHGEALMVETQAKKAPQLLPGSGAAWAAVIALRHHDPVPGMPRRNRGVDGKNAAVAGRDLVHHAREKILVLAVHRCDQRATSARDERRGLLLVAIRDDGRGRTEHLDLVHRLRLVRAFEPEQCRCNEGGFSLVDAVERGGLGAAADDRSFRGQAADPVERGRLLGARHQRPHARIRLSRVANLGRLELFG